MHIVVIGAGAMGALFGARLSAAGHDVLLYDVWQEHVAAIEERGLFIEGPDGTPIRYQVRATDSPPQSLRGADLVLVQVKSYDTYSALAPLEARINPESLVLSLQNGLGNDEAMRRALPNHSRILLGTTAHGAGIVRPGRIRHAGTGPTVIGDPDVERSPRLNLVPVRNAFREAAFATEISDNILPAIWLKLAANISINPLTAITGIRNGQILEDTDLLDLADAAIAEAVEVMRAVGVDAPERDYHAFARQVMRDTGLAQSSMLQDIQNGRRTEIDAICGAVARIGAEVGVPAPVNRWLTALIHNGERASRDIRKY
ncbi:MAG TPA: 2-dehydropantoate 2-reductase [Thermomicrobiales bacterium]|nr:2-dehydropantoate 2-reductase [Thermomicrobiales bacterium]